MIFSVYLYVPYTSLPSANVLRSCKSRLADTAVTMATGSLLPCWSVVRGCECVQGDTDSGANNATESVVGSLVQHVILRQQLFFLHITKNGHKFLESNMSTEIPECFLWPVVLEYTTCVWSGRWSEYLLVFNLNWIRWSSTYSHTTSVCKCGIQSSLYPPCGFKCRLFHWGSFGRYQILGGKISAIAFLCSVLHRF